MLRLPVLLLAICFAANAQFFGLSTTADGSRVYFATPLRQKNTTQPSYGKLFQVNTAGLQLYLSRDKILPPTPPFEQSAQSNPYDLVAASVSSDGRTFAAAATRSCYGDGMLCTRSEAFTTTITAGGKDADFPGHLGLSPSGEWAFGHGSNAYFLQAAYLVHVTTGELVPLAIPRLDSVEGVRIASSGRSVADDGSVVYSTLSEVVFLRSSEVHRIPATGVSPQDAVIDRSGATILFSVCGPNKSASGVCIPTIRMVDPSLSTSSLLIDDGYAPALSDDGRTLLYLSNRTGKPQLRVYSFDGGLDRQIAFDQAGISQAILSGDGSTIYAVTLGARLLKISVATRAVQELIPRTPYLSGILNGSFPAPGKLTTLPGVGLTDLSFTADAPLPDSLNGIRVNLAGKPVRIQSVTPDAITVLVPPDAAVSDNLTISFPVDLSLTSPSPFDAPSEQVYVTRYAPEFLLVPGANRLLAAHQDWSSVVSEDSPAQPGEVIHAYAVGLGDTSPSVPYGQPAPAAEPFARMTIPLGCGDSNNTTGHPVEVLFQGLAPKFAGIYQIDLRVPPDTSSGLFGIYCMWGGIGTGGPGLAGSIAVRSSAAPGAQ
jgi:uncharacterized protein (TIGR03437 family)